MVELLLQRNKCDMTAEFTTMNSGLLDIISLNKLYKPYIGVLRIAKSAHSAISGFSQDASFTAANRRTCSLNLITDQLNEVFGAKLEPIHGWKNDPD